MSADCALYKWNEWRHIQTWKRLIVHCKQSKCQWLQVLAGDDTLVLTSPVSTADHGALGDARCYKWAVSPQLSAGSGVGGTRRSVLSHKVTVTTLCCVAL